MPITRALAIRILRYLHEHKDFYFPFLVMCREYTPEDDDFVEIEPEEWEMIAGDEEYQTFELWERVQNLDEDAVRCMAIGFLEEMDISTYQDPGSKTLDEKFSVKPTVFTITKEEVDEMFEEVKEEDDLEEGATLTHEEIKKILEYVECDEMLAKDIRTSIRSSIRVVLEEG